MRACVFVSVGLCVFLRVCVQPACDDSVGGAQWALMRTRGQKGTETF